MLLTRATPQQREWERRLAEDGLEPVETRGGRMVSTMPAAPYVEKALTDNRQGYYEACRHFAMTGRLRGELGQVWRLHADGLSVRKIATVVGCYKRRIENHIARGRMEMAKHFAGGGDRSIDKGDKGVSTKIKRKQVLSMLSDLESALWQTCKHQYRTTKTD